MTPEQQWRLQTLRIRFKDYGEDKGKYVGEIEFENGQSEAFKFQLTPDETRQFLSIISKKVIDTANGLGQKLSVSVSQQIENQ